MLSPSPLLSPRREIVKRCFTGRILIYRILLPLPAQLTGGLRAESRMVTKLEGTCGGIDWVVLREQ
jgi:hypothetical protein